MLPVPEASLPAVEICSERSTAGYTRSPRLHVVVGQEHHPQPPAHGRVHVHDLGDAHDEADDQLGHGVARRRLAAEDHRARRQILAVAAHAQVLLHHLQGRQVLALVFVDALHLHIEQGGGIHQQRRLLLAMDRAARRCLHLPACTATQRSRKPGRRQRLQPLQLGEIPPPALAQHLA
jgi:hypothetical protein